MTTQEVLRAILTDLRLDVKQFSERIDYPSGKLYDIQRGKTIKFKDDLINRILAAFPKYNKIWLMTGEGDKYNTPIPTPVGKKSESKTTNPTDPSSSVAVTQPSPNCHVADTSGTPRQHLPLIPIDAVAGFNGIDSPGVRLVDCAMYEVPDFAEVHAEFLVRVSGSSMYPKYSSGDILACRKVPEITFIQWGKIYVIDSNQGAMVKRLFEIEGENDVLLCKSDNPNYPPFRLPKSEIRSLSVVVGAIRLE